MLSRRVKSTAALQVVLCFGHSVISLHTHVVDEACNPVNTFALEFCAWDAETGHTFHCLQRDEPPTPLPAHEWIISSYGYILKI